VGYERGDSRVSPMHGRRNGASKVQFRHAGKLKPASLLPQLRRANSFRGLPYHSVDIIVTPNIITDEVFPGLPPTKRAHSGLTDHLSLWILGPVHRPGGKLAQRAGKTSSRTQLIPGP